MPASLRRPASVLIALLGLMLGAMALAVPSSAAPYSNQTVIAASTQNPQVGQTLTVTGTGFAATERVDLVMHTVTYSLGSTVSDAAGNFSTSVTLPAGVSGPHTIVATGVSGATSSTEIVIGSASGSAGGDTGGGLPNTGAAVLGISAVGLALLIGGAVILIVGRRRRVGA